MANSWDEFFASPIKASKKLHVTAQDVARGAKIDARNAQRKAAAEALIAEQSRTVPTGLPYGMTPRPSTVPSDAPSMYSGDNEKVSPTLINDAIAKMTLVGAGNIVGFTPGVGLRAGFSVPAGLDAVANPQEGEVPAAIAGMGALGKATFPALAVLGTAYAANAEAMPFHSWMKRLGASGLPEKTSLYINPDRSELVRMLKDARETYPTDPTVRLLRDRRNTDIYGVEGSSILHDDMRKHLGMTYERAPGTQGSTLPALETEMDFLKQMAPGKFADGGLVKSGLKMLFPNLSSPLHVVKPKGGNWLSGTVEEALRPLKNNVVRYDHPRFNELLPEDQARLHADGVFGAMDNFPPEVRTRINEKLNPINSWIEGPLTKYVKTRMASPDDEVRRLAEEGVLHVDPAQLPAGNRQVHHTGENLQKLSASPAALRWENASDYAIHPRPAFYYQDFGSSNMRGDPSWDWVHKLDPNAPLYAPYGKEISSDLGFPHLIDELSNALDPNSGLPRHLQLSPDAVKNLSMEKAVRRVSDINAWRAAQKIEASQKIAGGPGQELVREYPHTPATPNPKGLRWVELKKSETLPEGWSFKPGEGEYAGYDWYFDPEGKAHNAMNDPRHADLEKQLKYEGDTMGHCVGGYCEDVVSGKSRIFSLRDAKGEPHVTVEVAPPQPRNVNDWYSWAKNNPEEYSKLNAEFGGDMDAKLKAATERYPNPASIVQIKGKQNRKPNDEYLPFVQDFVKNPPHGQPWAEVGDLQNTGMFKVQQGQKWPGFAEDMPEGFYTLDEAHRLATEKGMDPEVLDRWMAKLKNPYQGFASGGSVGVPAAGWELLTDPTGSPAENKLSWDIFSGHNDPEQLEAVQ